MIEVKLTEIQIGNLEKLISRLQLKLNSLIRVIRENENQLQDLHRERIFLQKILGFVEVPNKELSDSEIENLIGV